MDAMKIKQLRRHLQMTQEEFAHKLGFSSEQCRSYVSHLERGRRVPTGSLLVLLEVLYEKHLGGWRRRGGQVPPSISPLAEDSPNGPQVPAGAEFLPNGPRESVPAEWPAGEQPGSPNGPRAAGE